MSKIVQVFLYQAKMPHINPQNHSKTCFGLKTWNREEKKEINKEKEEIIFRLTPLYSSLYCLCIFFSLYFAEFTCWKKVFPSLTRAFSNEQDSAILSQSEQVHEHWRPLGSAEFASISVCAIYGRTICRCSPRKKILSKHHHSRRRLQPRWSEQRVQVTAEKRIAVTSRRIVRGFALHPATAKLATAKLLQVLPLTKDKA